MAHTPRLHFPCRRLHPLVLSTKVRARNPTRTIKLESYPSDATGPTLLSLLGLRLSSEREQLERVPSHVGGRAKAASA